MSQFVHPTVTEVIEGSGPIWIINTSEEASSTNGIKGDVYMTVSYHGKNSSLRIPKTWLPLDLTKEMPRKALVESVQLLQLFRARVIKPISADYAQHLLTQEGAKEERSRIDEEESRVSAEMRNAGLAIEVTNQETGEVRSLNMANTESAAEKPTVDARIISLATKINSMEHIPALNELKGFGSLSVESATYIYEALDDKRHSRLKEILAKKLGVKTISV